MPDNENDVDIAVLQEQVKTLRKDQEEAYKLIKSLQSDRDKALIWGILVLGSAVLTMGGWILKHVMKVIT
jgi:hypothetical protein